MSGSKSSAIAANWQCILTTFVKQSETIIQTVQRQRKLSAETFVQAMVLGCLQTPTARLRDFVQVAEQLGTSVTISSFDERINDAAVMLLASVLQCCLSQQVTTPALPVKRLQKFSGVQIVDSTQITLPETLYDDFAGNGHKAKLKAHLAFDYLYGTLNTIDFVAGRCPDQKATTLETIMAKDALYLFDLGYFKQETLRDLNQTEAFYVTRLQAQVALYAGEHHEHVELAAILNTLSDDHFTACYYLGSRVKTPVRIVARRVSEELASKRRRHAKAKAKKAGKTCTSNYLKFLGWEVLVTNLDAEWTLDDLFLLYGLRWQIEIVFKVWKSRLGVASLGDWRAPRVLCQLYAHLIGAVLLHNSVAHMRYSKIIYTSLAKSVDVIRDRIPPLLIVLRHNGRGLKAWARKLVGALQRFAQHEKRKTTPTTIQMLIDWGLT